MKASKFTAKKSHFRHVGYPLWDGCGSTVSLAAIDQVSTVDKSPFTSPAVQVDDFFDANYRPWIVDMSEGF